MEQGEESSRARSLSLLSPSAAQQATRRHQSLNVFALVTRLNRISYWIPTTVLWHETDAKRARVIGKFIEIARDLRALNNFHTLMG